MSELRSPNSAEILSHPRPLQLRGEIVLAQAKREWAKTRQPVLLLDVGQLRQERLAEYRRASAVALATPPQPLSPIKVESPIPPTSDPSAPVEFEPITSVPVPAVSLPSTQSWSVLYLLKQTSTLLPSWHWSNISWPQVQLPSWPQWPPWQLRLWPQSFISPKRALNFTSNFFLGGAIALFLLFSTPILILETQPLISQAIGSLQGVTPSFGKPSTQLPPPSPSPSPEPLITSQEDVFSVAIPDLDIKSRVIPNIDPSDPTDYNTALKEGIAHAKGTGLPDQLELNKTIYLFAHSTDSPWNILRYNAQFYALKDAEIGQKIEVVFWGKQYTYIIEEKRIVESDDVSALLPQLDKQQLILQTCYPPGTTNKRLLVIATPSATLE